MDTEKRCGTCKYCRWKSLEYGWYCQNKNSDGYEKWTAWSWRCEKWEERKE